MARIARRQLTEHRLDIGGISVDVGHHHQDVARPQRLALATFLGVMGPLEGRQQAVVEDLDLAQRRVSADQTDGVVIGREHPRTALGQRTLAGVDQLEYLVLDLLQQRCLLGWRVLADARHEDVQLEIEAAVAPRQRTLEFIQADDEVTPLCAKPCQQRVGLEVQLLLRQPDQRRRLGVTGTLLREALAVHALAVCSRTAPHGFAVGDDIAPVMAAGIGDHQIDVHHPGQRMQCIQRLARQRRDTEHEQAWRQWMTTCRGQCLQRARRRDEATMQGGAVMLAAAGWRIGQHRAPQCRLPLLAVRQVVGQQIGRQLACGLLTREGIPEVVVFQPALPTAYPLGAIVEVLIEQVRQLAGQLPLLTFGLGAFGQRRQCVLTDRLDQLATLVATQVIPERRIAFGLGFIGQQPRQQAQQTPGKRALVEGRQLRNLVAQHAAQYPAIGTPYEA